MGFALEGFWTTTDDGKIITRGLGIVGARSAGAFLIGETGSRRGTVQAPAERAPHYPAHFAKYAA